MQIFDAQGRRLYFTEEERRDFLKAAVKAPREVRSFCSTVLYTGCRISEALELSADRVNLSSGNVVIRSLKKRKDKAGKPRIIHRVVPIPPDLVDALDMVHGIRELQRKGRGGELLWPWSRMTGYRKIMEIIEAAHISAGPHACPKGLRHGFGIHAVSKGISLNMVQKWLGHAQLTTTAIYANAVGEEEQSIAARMWS